jgi:hypothetical protein
MTVGSLHCAWAVCVGVWAGSPSSHQPPRNPQQPRGLPGSRQLAAVSLTMRDPSDARVKPTPRAWTWAALMHRAFAIDVLACPHCGGRLRLIATLHDPAVIRKILAHVGVGPSGPSPGPAPPKSGAATPDRNGSGARRTPSCLRSEAPSALIRPVRRPVDGGGVSGIACRSPGPARSTCEEPANVRCAVGSWGGRRPSPGGYVAGTGATDGGTAAGGR